MEATHITSKPRSWKLGTLNEDGDDDDDDDDDELSLSIKVHEFMRTDSTFIDCKIQAEIC